MKRNILFGAIVLILLTVISCTSTRRHDLGTVKKNGTEFAYVQSKLLGIPLGEPKLKPLPSHMDMTREMIQKPAKWLLWIALPGGIAIAILGIVSVVYLQNPRLARLSAIVSVSLFVAAMGATAWLLATANMLIFIVLIVMIVSLLIFWLYKKTKGMSLRDIMNARK